MEKVAFMAAKGLGFLLRHVAVEIIVDLLPPVTDIGAPPARDADLVRPRRHGKEAGPGAGRNRVVRQ